MKLRRIGSTLLALSTAAAAAHAGGLRFEDGSGAAGIDLVTWSGSREKPHILESTGNGLLAVDYDGDGDQDLYVVAAYPLPAGDRPHEGSRLFRNEGGGGFRDVTGAAGAGLDGYGQGGCVGDADGDGLPDLYVTAFGENGLLRNRGNGTFENATATAGVAEPSWSLGCAFLDGDGDGDQDLFVANYIEASWEDVASARRTRLWRGKVAVMDGPRGLPEAANRYFRNRGDGTFEEATEAAGLADRGYSMAATAFDADADGHTDLYVANDSTPNRLYRARGDGSFEEIGSWNGTGFNADGEVQGSMGIGVGDLDGDGRPDLVVTNFAHDYYAFYRNVDGTLFEDASFASGLAAPTYRPLGWAAIPLDADRDGDLDLFLANGHIYPQVDEDSSLGESFRQPNQMFLNEGGRLREVTAEAGPGMAVRASSRGAVALDLEEDGDLDLVVSNQDERPTVLVNRTDPAGRFVAFAFAPSGATALATRVAIAAGPLRSVAELTSGGSYASQSELRVRAGLGAASTVDVAEVRWPQGARRRYLRLRADRVYRLSVPSPE